MNISTLGSFLVADVPISDKFALCFSSMFGMGMGEVIIIVVVALLALGPEKLPEAAKKLGQVIRGLRRQTTELRQTIEQDTQLGDAMREIRSALNEDVLNPKSPKPNAEAKPNNAEAKPNNAEASEASSDTSGSDSSGESTVVPATEGHARGDDLDDSASQASNNKSSRPRPLSEYESYIHLWGAEAAAKKYGTTLEHAEETLKATLDSSGNGG